MSQHDGGSRFRSRTSRSSSEPTACRWRFIGQAWKCLGSSSLRWPIRCVGLRSRYARMSQKVLADSIDRKRSSNAFFGWRSDRRMKCGFGRAMRLISVTSTKKPGKTGGTNTRSSQDNCRPWPANREFIRILYSVVCILFSDHGSGAFRRAMKGQP